MFLKIIKKKGTKLEIREDPFEKKFKKEGSIHKKEETGHVDAQLQPCESQHTACRTHRYRLHAGSHVGNLRAQLIEQLGATPMHANGPDQFPK